MRATENVLPQTSAIMDCSDWHRVSLVLWQIWLRCMLKIQLGTNTASPKVVYWQSNWIKRSLFVLKMIWRIASFHLLLTMSLNKASIEVFTKLGIHIKWKPICINIMYTRRIPLTSSSALHNVLTCVRHFIKYPHYDYVLKSYK